MNILNLSQNLQIARTMRISKSKPHWKINQIILILSHKNGVLGKQFYLSLDVASSSKLHRIRPGSWKKWKRFNHK